MKNLKTLLFLPVLALSLALGLSACEDILGVAPILKYGAGTYDFTIPATEARDTTLEESIKTADVIAYIEKAGYGIDKFKRVSVTAASFEITGGTTTFDVIDNATVSFSADGSDAKEFASVAPEKKGLTKVALTVDSKINLIDLFKKESLTAIATIATNAPITEEVPVTVNYSLSIEPNL